MEAGCTDSVGLAGRAAVLPPSPLREPWADWAIRDEPFGELVQAIGVGLSEPSPRRHSQNQE